MRLFILRHKYVTVLIISFDTHECPLLAQSIGML